MSYLIWFWKLNSGRLQWTQALLSAEPSLQPLKLVLVWKEGNICFASRSSALTPPVPDVHEGCDWELVVVLLIALFVAHLWCCAEDNVQGSGSLECSCGAAGEAAPGNEPPQVSWQNAKWHVCALHQLHALSWQPVSCRWLFFIVMLITVC